MEEECTARSLNNSGPRLLSSAFPASRLSRFIHAERRRRSTRTKSRSPPRNEPVAGHGSSARDLLGGEHGAAWGVLGWANVVLGRSAPAAAENTATGVTVSGFGGYGAGAVASSPHRGKSAAREFTKLDQLDAGHLGRLAAHVLQRRRASDGWTCTCKQSNRAGVQQCEACFLARSQGKEDPGSSGCGGCGDYDDGERERETDNEAAGVKAVESGKGAEETTLSVREARLWRELSELRDLPVQDSLAVYPAGLDARAMTAMLQGENPLLLCGLMRFLMECDEAVALASDNHLNPLYAHAPLSVGRKAPSSTRDASPGLACRSTPLPGSSVSPVIVSTAKAEPAGVSTWGSGSGNGGEARSLRVGDPGGEGRRKPWDIGTSSSSSSSTESKASSVARCLPSPRPSPLSSSIGAAVGGGPDAAGTDARAVGAPIAQAGAKAVLPVAKEVRMLASSGITKPETQQRQSLAGVISPRWSAQASAQAGSFDGPVANVGQGGSDGSGGGGGGGTGKSYFTRPSAVRAAARAAAMAGRNPFPPPFLPTSQFDSSAPASSVASAPPPPSTLPPPPCNENTVPRPAADFSRSIPAAAVASTFSRPIARAEAAPATAAAKDPALAAGEAGAHANAAATAGWREGAECPRHTWEKRASLFPVAGSQNGATGSLRADTTATGRYGGGRRERRSTHEKFSSAKAMFEKRPAEPTTEHKDSGCSSSGDAGGGLPSRRDYSVDERHARAKPGPSQMGEDGEKERAPSQETREDCLAAEAEQPASDPDFEAQQRVGGAWADEPSARRRQSPTPAAGANGERRSGADGVHSDVGGFKDISVDDEKEKLTRGRIFEYGLLGPVSTEEESEDKRGREQVDEAGPSNIEADEPTTLEPHGLSSPPSPCQGGTRAKSSPDMSPPAVMQKLSFTAKRPGEGRAAPELATADEPSRLPAPGAFGVGHDGGSIVASAAASSQAPTASAKGEGVTAVDSPKSDEDADLEEATTASLVATTASAQPKAHASALICATSSSSSSFRTTSSDGKGGATGTTTITMTTTTTTTTTTTMTSTPNGHNARAVASAASSSSSFWTASSGEGDVDDGAPDSAPVNMAGASTLQRAAGNATGSVVKRHGVSGGGGGGEGVSGNVVAAVPLPEGNEGAAAAVGPAAAVPRRSFFERSPLAVGSASMTSTSSNNGSSSGDNGRERPARHQAHGVPRMLSRESSQELSNDGPSPSSPPPRSPVAAVAAAAARLGDIAEETKVTRAGIDAAPAGVSPALEIGLRGRLAKAGSPILRAPVGSGSPPQSPLRYSGSSPRAHAFPTPDTPRVLPANQHQLTMTTTSGTATPATTKQKPRDLAAPRRSSEALSSASSPHAADSSAAAAVAPLASPRRRACLSPGPVRALGGGSTRRLSTDSRSPRKNEQKYADGRQQAPPAPCPGGNAGSSGGFPSPYGGGTAPLQAATTTAAATANDSVRHRQNLSISPAAQHEDEAWGGGAWLSSPDELSSPGLPGRRRSSDGRVESKAERNDDSEGRGKVSDLAPLARELPAFLAQAVGLSGSLRALASCQAVSREWRDALGGVRSKELFGSIVRASGVSASLRPAVWQMLVLRAVRVGGKHRRGSSAGGGAGVGVSGSGSGGGGGREPFSASSPLSSADAFARLVDAGAAGPHAALIARDVPRAFGAIAPHKRRDNGKAPSTTTITAITGTIINSTKSNYNHDDDSSNAERGTVMTPPRSRTMTPRTDERRNRRRRTTIGGAHDRGGGSGRGPFGGEGLGFFGGAVGGALTNLLGGGWRRDDDEKDLRVTGTPPPPRRGGEKALNHRRQASSSRAASGAVAENSVSSPKERDRGGFKLASLSPFGDYNGNSTGGGGGGGRGTSNPRTPSPAPSDRHFGCPDAPTEESGAAGGGVSPAASRRRMTSGGGDGDGGRLSPNGRRRPARSAVPLANKAITASAAAAAASGKERILPAPAIPSAAPAADEAARQVEGAATEPGGREVDGDENDDDDDGGDKDAAWLARSEKAWAAVPLESKRECLRNVLLAIAAKFPDVGYCQGMDRLVTMLMMFYFVSPEDTNASSITGAVTPTMVVSMVSSALPSPKSGGGGGGSGGNLTLVEEHAATNDFGVPSPASVTSDATLASSALPPAAPATAAAGAVESGEEGRSCKTASRRPTGVSGHPSPALRISPPPPCRPAEARLLGERVYTVFSGLFEGFRLHDLYLPERGGVLVCTEVLTLLAARRLPELAGHFNAIDFSVDLVATGWFQTLFVYLHAMPRATVRRIWDWWLSSGDFEVLFRVSMAILDLSKDHLMSLDFDGTVKYFNNFPEPSVLSPNVLLPSAAAVSMEDGELMYLELQVRQKEKLEVPSVTQLMLRPVL